MLLQLLKFNSTHGGKFSKFGLALLQLASALRRCLSKQVVMLLLLLELQCALSSEFDKLGVALLELASGLRPRLGEKSIILLQSCKVRYPDKAICAEERYR